MFVVSIILSQDWAQTFRFFSSEHAQTWCEINKLHSQNQRTCTWYGLRCANKIHSISQSPITNTRLASTFEQTYPSSINQLSILESAGLPSGKALCRSSRTESVSGCKKDGLEEGSVPSGSSSSSNSNWKDKTKPHCGFKTKQKIHDNELGD